MQSKKNLIICLLSAVLVISQAIPVYAAGWIQTNNNWQYHNDNGTCVTGWKEDSSKWYYMDSTGNMKTGLINDGTGIYYLDTSGAMATGWKQINNEWYFFSNKSKSETSSYNMGQLVTGWHYIDGKCYLMDATGKMYSNCTTPDGYTVNESGAWTINGTIQTGTSEFSTIVNTPAKTTGLAKAPSGGGSGGGGGGGSSSSGHSSSGSSGLQNTPYYRHDYNYGNASVHSISMQKECEVKVNQILSEIITEDMTDFEKEMAIINWMNNNITYALINPIVPNHATRYGALIDGTCRCEGYADAFLALGQAAGLNVKFNYNDKHAWNQIELDGEWYCVDTTNSADTVNPVSYINTTYLLLKDITPINYSNPVYNTSNCVGTKYGYNTVKHYIETGEVDTSIITKTDAQIMQERLASCDYVINVDNSSIEKILENPLDNMVGKGSIKVGLITSSPNGKHYIYEIYNNEISHYQSTRNYIKGLVVSDDYYINYQNDLNTYIIFTITPVLDKTASPSDATEP